MKSLLSLTLLLCAAVLQASSESIKPEPVSCISASPTGCGNTVNLTHAQFPDLTVPVYVFSDEEKEGTCERSASVRYAGDSSACVQSIVSGECTCVDKTCQACIEGKELADLESCCGSNFQYNNYVIPLLGEESGKSTCCRAKGTDSKGKAASACYCERSTEGCFYLCPAVPPTGVTNRIFGGTKVESCGTGAVRFSFFNSVLCNGIYAYNPSGKDSTGASLSKPVVYVPKVCLKGFDALLNQEQKIADLMVTVGDNSFPYKPSEVTRKQTENDYFEVLMFDSYNGPCMDKPVCTYDNTTMANAINKQDCNMLSFGADTIAISGNPAFSGNLNTLPVIQIGAIGACKDGSGAAAECFFPINLASFTCLGDLGAPIFCSLNTGEKVLYGSFGQSTVCAPEQKVYPVLPINTSASQQ